MNIRNVFLLVVALILAAGSAVGQPRMPQLPPPNLGQPVGPSPASGSAPGSAPAAAPETVSPGEMPEVTISARLNQTEVPAGEPFQFIITVSWQKKPGGQTAELDFDFPDPPKSEGIRVTGNSFKASATADRGVTQVKREYAYEMTADKEGKLNIGAAEVIYRRRGSSEEQRLSTAPLDLTVGPPRMKLLEKARPHLAKLVIAGVLVLAVAGLVVLALRDRRKKAAPPPEPTETLEDRYLRKLKDNESFRIAGRYADYFLGLAGVLKGYLRERYDLRTQGQTSDKIAEALKAQTDPETADAVRSALHLCDRVKFAGHQPSSAEMDRAYEVAKSLIEKSRGLARQAPTPT